MGLSHLNRRGFLASQRESWRSSRAWRLGKLPLLTPEINKSPSPNRRALPLAEAIKGGEMSLKLFYFMR
jgi:hypothetical protein